MSWSSVDECAQWSKVEMNHILCVCMCFVFDWAKKFSSDQFNVCFVQFLFLSFWSLRFFFVCAKSDFQFLSMENPLPKALWHMLANNGSISVAVWFGLVWEQFFPLAGGVRIAFRVGVSAYNRQKFLKTIFNQTTFHLN